MTLFTEQHQSEHFKALSFGVIELNEDTINQAASILAQHMPTDESTIIDVKNSILENGYKPSFPIVLHSETMRTVDGYTRLRACIELVEEGLLKEVFVPYFTANESGKAFNSATRGMSATEIEYIFNTPRHNGLITGSSRRAAEQAIEASKILDVAKLDGNFDKAFDSTRVQSHTSKIVREQETFKGAYKAICEIANQLNQSPDALKWAHWMAFFCRHGATSSNKAIAMKNTLPLKGTTQRARYDAFVKCCEESIKLGGL